MLRRLNHRKDAAGLLKGLLAQVEAGLQAPVPIGRGQWTLDATAFLRSVSPDSPALSGMARAIGAAKRGMKSILVEDFDSLPIGASPAGWKGQWRVEKNQIVGERKGERKRSRNSEHGFGRNAGRAGRG